MWYNGDTLEKGEINMSEKQISSELMKLVKKAQIDEEMGSVLYSFMSFY